jgi:ADP-ribose pyrophosphatase
VRSRERPEGAKSGWLRLSTRYPFVTKWLRLREDRVRLEGGREIQFAFVESNGAVGVVPVMRDGRVALIKQYRYTVDEWCYEIPAGGMHDTGGAAREEVALQELQQEVGGRCDSLEYVNHFHASIGNSSQTFYVFLAWGVELDGSQTLEVTERIEIVPTPAAEALRMARDGEIRDGASALALLLCEDLLRQYGYI